MSSITLTTLPMGSNFLERSRRSYTMILAMVVTQEQPAMTVSSTASCSLRARSALALRGPEYSAHSACINPVLKSQPRAASRGSLCLICS
eukprot:1281398-Pyramimonas_sp.AAC.1